MGFMKTVKNMSAESQIEIFEVKYFAFDVQYNYELKPSSCVFKGNLQHVEMMLICRGKTGTGLFYIYMHEFFETLTTLLTRETIKVNTV